ncbi:YmfQ family protein [Silvimonas sp. JCM 19000]
MAVTSEDYRQQLSSLLPLGVAWSRNPDSVLQQLLAAFGAGFAAVHGRVDDLLREVFPLNSHELLDDYERVCGLPDECTVQGALTLAERQAAVATRLASTGGQSRAYFIGIAAAAGYSNATITEFRARRHGRARMGERYAGTDWQFVWQFNLPVSQVLHRRSGQPMGEPYQVFGNASFECTINKLKPAHTRVFFAYG